MKKSIAANPQGTNCANNACGTPQGAAHAVHPLLGALPAQRHHQLLVAAYLARRRFGYPAGEVAKALGYRRAGSITRAVARMEPGNERLKRTAAKLERKLH